MTTVVMGGSLSLVAEWRLYAGGPMAAVTGVTIGITRIVGGAVAIAPTGAGVTSPATGVNVYSWSVGGSLVPGDYLVAWTGVDGQGDTVTATEVVTVLAAAAGMYTDLATVKLGLGKLTADDRDELIIEAIAAASQMIDERTGRTFDLAASATPRTFPARDRAAVDGDAQSIRVDDIGDDADMTVETKVGFSGTWTSVATWEPGPDNADVRGRPWTEVVGAAGWLTDTTKVRVTARWGWPAVPDGVTQAAALLAARLYRRKDSPNGVIGSADWGAIRVSRFDPDVENLIAPYILIVA